METKTKNQVLEGEPKLENYDWIIISSSGGKDSQAMLDHMVRLAKQKQYPIEKLIVVHADLGKVEWEGTKELAEKQAKHYGLEFIVTKQRTNTGEEIDLLERVRRRGKWPSNMQRYCTSDFKRGPISRVYTMLAKKIPNKPAKLLVCMGLRAEESPARKKKPAYFNDFALSNGQKQIDVWLPIHQWTTVQVWDCIKKSGVPHHSAYDKGMPRLSCVFCIFAPKSALIIAGKHNPKLLDEYVKVEKEINHLFREKCSMQDIKDAIENGEIEKCKDEKWNM